MMMQEEDLNSQSKGKETMFSEDESLANEVIIQVEEFGRRGCCFETVKERQVKRIKASQTLNEKGEELLEKIRSRGYNANERFKVKEEELENVLKLILKLIEQNIENSKYITEKIQKLRDAMKEYCHGTRNEVATSRLNLIKRK